MRTTDTQPQMACHAPTIILANPTTPYVLPSLHEILMSQAQREGGCYANPVHTVSAACHCGQPRMIGPGRGANIGESSTGWNMTHPGTIHHQTCCQPRYMDNQPPNPAQGGVATCTGQATQGQHNSHRAGHNNTRNQDPRNQSSRVVPVESYGGLSHHEGGHYTNEAPPHGQSHHAHGPIGTHTNTDAIIGESVYTRHQDGNPIFTSVTLPKRRRNRKNKRRRAEGYGRPMSHTKKGQGHSEMHPNISVPSRGEDYVRGYVEHTGGQDTRWQTSVQNICPMPARQSQPTSVHVMQDSRWDVGGENTTATRTRAPVTVGHGPQNAMQSLSPHMHRGGPNATNTSGLMQRATEIRRDGRTRHNPFSSQHAVSVPGAHAPLDVHLRPCNAGQGYNNIQIPRMTRPAGQIGNVQKKRASGVDTPRQW